MTEQKTLQVDGEQIACEFVLADQNVVFIHGAGKADRTRHRPLAAELRSRGLGTVLFDLSGHGESSGTLDESSLSRRAMQASGVIDELLAPGSQFYLVGFSMGGQIVCDLTAKYGDRIRGILLGCPGIYTSTVNNLVFGSDEFTEGIREDKNWAHSSALQALSNFEGTTVVAIGGEDAVIPAGVIESIKEAAQQLTYVEYPGVSHALGQWLATQPKALAQLADNLTQ